MLGRAGSTNRVLNVNNFFDVADFDQSGARSCNITMVIRDVTGVKIEVPRREIVSPVGKLYVFIEIKHAKSEVQVSALQEA